MSARMSSTASASSVTVAGAASTHAACMCSTRQGVIRHHTAMPSFNSTRLYVEILSLMTALAPISYPSAIALISYSLPCAPTSRAGHEHLPRLPSSLRPPYGSVPWLRTHCPARTISAAATRDAMRLRGVYVCMRACVCIYMYIYI